MDAKTLKTAIENDLITLKTVETEPLEANRYWGEIAKVLGMTYGFVFATTVILTVIAKAMGAQSAFDIAFFQDDIHCRSTLLATLQKAGVVSLFPCAFVMQYVNGYVLLKHQFLPHLKTGAYFLRQAHKAGWLAAFLYIVSYSIMVYGTGPSGVVMAEIASLIFTVLGVAMLATAEIERIGAGFFLKAMQCGFKAFNKVASQD